MQSLNFDVAAVNKCQDSSFSEDKNVDSENVLLQSDARVLIERQSKAKNSIYLNGHPYYGYFNGTDVLQWTLPKANNIRPESFDSQPTLLPEVNKPIE
jgi:hypothetical protein